MDDIRIAPADIATTTCILMGFSAVVVAGENVHTAAVFIFCAVLLDGLDGVLARKFGSASDGMMFDTLSDVVSFSVAPSVLVFEVADTHLQTIVAGAISGILLVSAVLHLRRFVRNEQTIGCQTTVASIVIAMSTGIAFNGLTAIMAIVSSMLMMRRVEYPGDIPIRLKLLGGLIVSVTGLSIYYSVGTEYVVAIGGFVIFCFMIFSPYIGIEN